jgi:hypothetical protein
MKASAIGPDIADRGGPTFRDPGDRVAVVSAPHATGRNGYEGGPVNVFAWTTPNPSATSAAV